MAVKLVYLVLDGAADKPFDGIPTPLQSARKEALDSLASNAICGTMWTIGRGVAPESDAAVLSLLGYDPERYYTGRGPLEALGAGVEFREEWEVAFRANFATINESTMEIIDRRVGRSLTSEEARELARALDGMRLLGHGYARVKATIGHRAVVVIGSEKYRLSSMVSNTDPAYERRGLVSVAVKSPSKRVKECRPLEDSLEARITCSLVNEFTRKSIEILSKHPVNIVREKAGKLKANIILLRDAGNRLPRVEPVAKRYNLGSAAAVVEMPVERGIAKVAGLRVYEVPPPTKNLERDLPLRLEAALKALAENRLVYVHLKGPDEPGHDGDYEGKRKSIEAIDKYFVKPLIESIDRNSVAVLVTSDHATPWSARTHTDDPVPFMLSHPSLPKGPGRFDETACSEKGEVIEHGWELLGKVVEIINKL